MNGHTSTRLCAHSQGTSGQAREEEAASVNGHTGIPAANSEE